ncbi:M23 family metallopeptidase [Pedobacter arcticus]|uniref:M23 family metallopeptidase n=1 Tax=Pedobacter arcticus TaxID=752140 RepID=UPI0006842D5B|nr:M23 family metallopeptidase [Pedobacter arcticus]
MKKICYTIILMFTFAIAYPQIESSNSEIVLSRFQKLYNESQFDHIYANFSDHAKASLSLKDTKNFLSQLQTKFGTIKKMDLLAYEGNFNVYKTELEKGVVSLFISMDGKKIGGIYALPYDPNKFAETKRNITPMRLPFKDEWTVFWGGDTREQNYHVVVKFQQNAFDLIIQENGKSYKTDGKTNEDYYCFGKEIIAPCNAEVAYAVDGVKDNIPGELNKMFILGNSVLLKTNNKEYILLAHFKQNTIKVKQGDIVKKGAFLGLSGNSGNSSEPHLHFHIQDLENFNKATGIKCFFNNILVNGILQKDYSLVKGDHIKAD